MPQRTQGKSTPTELKSETNVAPKSVVDSPQTISSKLASRVAKFQALPEEYLCMKKEPPVGTTHETDSNTKTESMGQKSRDPPRLARNLSNHKDIKQPKAIKTVLQFKTMPNVGSIVPTAAGKVASPLSQESDRIPFITGMDVKVTRVKIADIVTKSDESRAGNEDIPVYNTQSETVVKVPATSIVTKSSESETRKKDDNATAKPETVSKAPAMLFIVSSVHPLPPCDASSSQTQTHLPPPDPCLPHTSPLTNAPPAGPRPLLPSPCDVARPFTLTNLTFY